MSRQNQNPNSDMIGPVTLQPGAATAPSAAAGSVAIPGTAVPASPNARGSSTLFVAAPPSPEGAGNLSSPAPASPPSAPMARLDLKVSIPTSTHTSGVSSPRSAGSAGDAHPAPYSAPARLGQEQAAAVAVPAPTPTTVRMLRVLEEELGQGGLANNQDDCSCRCFCSFFCCSCCYQRCYGEEAQPQSARIANNDQMQREGVQPAPTLTPSN